jgi:hypothetical protein
MYQTELFPAADLGAAPPKEPRSLKEAMAAGHRSPARSIPMNGRAPCGRLSTSGNTRAAKGLRRTDFASRAVPPYLSTYVNRDGLTVEYHYDSAGSARCLSLKGGDHGKAGCFDC